MKKNVAMFLLLFSQCCALQIGDPFAKIIVRSDCAQFEKDSQDKSAYRLSYKNNVHVTFADDSSIIANNLDVLIYLHHDKDLVPNQKSSSIKKIVFTNRVKLARQNQTVWADTIEVLVDKKLCMIQGNVKIEQTKKSEKDVPFTTQCSRAQLAWESQEITLLGGQHEPVCTTIELAGCMKNLKKRKTA